MKKPIIRNGVVYKDGSKSMKKASSLTDCFGSLLHLALNNPNHVCKAESLISLRLEYTTENFLFIHADKEKKSICDLYFDLNDDPGM